MLMHFWPSDTFISYDYLWVKNIGWSLVKKKKSVIVKYLVNKVFSSCKINVRLFIYKKNNKMWDSVLVNIEREGKRV